MELLRKIQSRFVKGRKLDVENPEEAETGPTSSIYVDREDVLNSGLDEMKYIIDKDLCLEVNFLGEVCVFI